MYKGLIRFLVVVLLIPGCAKTKIDTPSALTGTKVINAPASSIRMFNFTSIPLDVKVNSIPLTAFSTDANAQGNQVGLAIFPANVWPNGDNGSPVTLPVSLEDKQSSMHIIIRPRIVFNLVGLGATANFNIDTILVDDPLHPNDYYMLGNGQLRVIPRNSVAPANPQHFKIRLYNLSSASDALGQVGHVCLTYADGTSVNPVLDSVGPDNVSPYIELPYGACQFKVYVAKQAGSGWVPDYTKQLTEIPGYPDMSNGTQTAQTALPTRVRDFLPGGTYSLVVTPNIFGYDFGSGPTYFQINAYRVLIEQNAPTNTDWAHIQGVNALSAQGISFRVDGVAMGTNTNIAYGQAGDYTVVSKGTHLVEALDGSGKVLGQQSFQLYPFDNITVWAYMNNGAPALLFSNTDFTSTLYESAASNVVDDGTDGSANVLQIPYAMQFRFLNLSDVPYITFTQAGNMLTPYATGGGALNQLQNDTVGYPQAYINLQPGVVVSSNPFFVFGGGGVAASGSGVNETSLPFLTGNGAYMPGTNPLPLRVYASEPATGSYAAQVPGTILAGVPTLTMNNFASGTMIYANISPRAELGYYTVALIGSTSAGQAQLIAVKHNK